MADRYNVVGGRGSDTASTESRAVVSEIACMSLGSQREMLMMAEGILGIVTLRISYGETKAYLDFRVRPIARPSIKASNTMNDSKMVMQMIFLLKPKYFL